MAREYYAITIPVAQSVNVLLRKTPLLTEVVEYIVTPAKRILSLQIVLLATIAPQEEAGFTAETFTLPSINALLQVIVPVCMAVACMLIMLII